MKIRFLIFCLCFVICAAFCTKSTQKPDILPNVPEGAQAVSLVGEPLHSPTPSDGTLEKLEEARKTFDADPANADNIIWFGRRIAYAGDYRKAIRIYTDGIGKFPDDARFYRHRGHRYISIREFDRAIQDFEKAATLIEGTEDRVEPDGMPNPMNIPISSLHSNIWYHLGLAYYLKHDLENAQRVYHIAVETSNNDDKLVSTTHWLYMILRLQGKDEEAEKALESIHKELNIIENQVYHRLCLFYKGEISLEEITGDEFSDIMSDAAAYGVGNWFFYNGQKDRAKRIFEKILANKTWASFGYIAAEADMVHKFSE
ncbi:MAG: tetratricopeptide repeat protein [Candidatus Aminicenantes bacterium]